MHLYVVIAFALLIWWTRDVPIPPLVTDNMSTIIIVAGQLAVVWILANLLCRTSLRLMRSGPAGPVAAQHRYHRTSFLLRSYVLASFAIDLILTNWPTMITSIDALSAVPALAELVVVSPFMIGMVLLFHASYPIDAAIRRCAVDAAILPTDGGHAVWNVRQYMSFNIRHQLLSVVAPMTIILLFHGVAQKYETQLERLLPIPWFTDIALGVGAAFVFLLAPWMLRHIWTTQPLPPGKLRSDLESICSRIGLKVRDILIWRSGGMYVNAAVMGLFAPVRYVMLSDGLLDAMNDKQIEAVFGREAGHVRHRHIPYFLLFALASMLIASGVMELIYRGSIAADGTERIGPAFIQAIGFAVIVALWGGGFGFISRRFERQADLFGARCVTPQLATECRQPCGTHMDPPSPSSNVALCATGAGIFTSALDRVAMLNGIPHDEPSWRHSSIASRIAFLSRLANDPSSVRRFDAVIRRIKATLIVVCVVGLGISVYYLWPFLVAMTSPRSRMM